MPIFSRGHFSTTPMTRETFLDLSELALIYYLLRNPDLRRYFVLKVEPYDPESQTVLERWYSTGIISVPGSPNVWSPRLVSAFNVTTDLATADDFEIGGGGRPTYGNISLAIGDEIERNYTIRDDFAWLDWHRRDLTLYLGGHPDDGWTWGDYAVIFRGQSDEVVWDEDILSIIVRDPTLGLQDPIQGTLYEGTGEELNEGGENLKGVPKPLAYGTILNATPRLIDRTYLVYQLHDGPIVGVDNVYDKGEAYTSYGDMPGGIPDIRSWSEIDGGYITNLANGLMRLGTQPNGAVTVDFRGDSDGGTLHETPGAIIQRILTDRAGWSVTDIDVATISGYDMNGHTVSVYIPNSRSVDDVIDDLLRPHGYRSYNSQGQIIIGHLAFRNPKLTLEPPRVVAISRDRTPPPVWRIRMGYDRNWTLMAEADLTIPDDRDIDADYAINEYRRVVVENAAVLGQNPSAKDLELDTLYTDVFYAQAEAEELFDFYSAERHIYRVTATHIAFRLRVGDSIILKYPRFGLYDGRGFLVTSVTENTLANVTQLILWG